MRQLTIIRHAKSSWDDQDASDQDRALANRGQRDLVLLAPHLVGTLRNAGPCYVSPAKRAQETAHNLVTMDLIPKHRLRIEQALYTFDGDDLVAWLRNRDDADHNLTMIGHNPALLELVNALYQPGIPRLPTLGVVALDLDCASWAAVDDGIAQLRCYLYPKVFKA
jgi:phosphohistidine phosphatase